MTWKREESNSQYRFVVEGEATMPQVRSPGARHFLPQWVVVHYLNGVLDRVEIGGSFLNKRGEPLRTQSGWTRYNLEDVTAASNGTAPADDQIPRWVLELLAGIFVPPGSPVKQS